MRVITEGLIHTGKIQIIINCKKANCSFKQHINIYHLSPGDSAKTIKHNVEHGQNLEVDFFPPLKYRKTNPNDAGDFSFGELGALLGSCHCHLQCRIPSSQIQANVLAIPHITITKNTTYKMEQ